ncbi:bifunctional rhamnulose-1-phosphate aldolase/short-chain dehydrogenase [Leifsonia sp. Root112D2]|uniref:bifunctional rhamnulose-1-phosphate aldolase/short-chain dehydrogenase n=1 Tax=Leifsonia sp. Root112D2 TaxID=1736426 RepID=UPI0006F9503C|nr:bifunctional rhamnulose-1-phosphate aldolase/short-chain dehydrogenase [Leifsonia sp. Root112D2]KQV05937.1 short-chain dehydrogenase [Leifsonia sp. Root112D2]
MTDSQHTSVSDLLRRSHALGADPRYTNYGGGNTSAKGTVTDPATGEQVELLWVKGSGGDLATLEEKGLAVLRRDRVLKMKAVYPGPDREDEMVAAFDFCMYGKGGAAPSIDTSMHALVEAAHVDHLHPDAGIAIATSTDGEALTNTIYGDAVVWVPWRRPGFQLGLDIAAIKEANPAAIGCILGGHGISAWGDTSAECERNSLTIIEAAEAYIAKHRTAMPFGGAREEFGPLDADARRTRAIELAPTLRAIASTDRPMVGHFHQTDELFEFMSSVKFEELSALGTSCPDHFLRTKVRPLVLDLAPTAGLDETVARLSELHEEYREEYRRYYEAYATPESPAMRGADPAIVLIPGVGMFSYGKDKQTARVAGEYFLNTINVMRGAEALSSYKPIPDSEKFRIEYWSLEEAKLARMPKPKPLATRIALVTGGGHGIGRAIALRLAAEGACVVIGDLNYENAVSVCDEIAAATGATQVSDVAIPIRMDVSDVSEITTGVGDALLAFGGLDLIINNAGLSKSASLFETTTADWDLMHDVMARGAFLVSREAAKVMVPQSLGGDIVYISSKNSVFAGPNNVAYSAAKADQAHQVRLLAAELGGHGIRVNGINPDGVVRGSGIFSSGWGASRAKVYGVAEEDLGEYYAQRTLLKLEVVPEDVAAAVVAIVGGDLAKTTGLNIPVDSGVAAAFLR